MTANAIRYEPDYTVPPGETLRERLDELGVTQAELAVRTGFTPKHINQIIQGLAPITHETAIMLERVTGTPARIWNFIEAAYRDGLARRTEQPLSPED